MYISGGGGGRRRHCGVVVKGFGVQSGKRLFCMHSITSHLQYVAMSISLLWSRINTYLGLKEQEVEPFLLQEMEVAEWMEMVLEMHPGLDSGLRVVENVTLQEK